MTILIFNIVCIFFLYKIKYIIFHIMSSTNIALIIFRCDLSIIDNLAVFDAIQNKHNNILFMVLINPEQFYINKKNKNYFSEKARDFFAMATKNLNNEIITVTKNKNNLIMLIEKKNTLIDFCLKFSIKYVYWNKLFSIYSIERDNNNKQILESHNINVIENLNHYYITPIYYNKIYKVFSAFYKFYSKNIINNIKYNNEIVFTNNITDIHYDFNILKIKPNIDYELFIEPSTKKANLLIKEFKQSDKKLISFLSKHIQFGVAGSIRFYYHQLKEKKDFVRQLFWRSFYISVQQFKCSEFYSPKIYNILDNRYNKIKWINDIHEAKRFWNAETGYPYLDSHIRMLHQTGYNFNLARLNLLCCAIKILAFDPFSDLEWAPQTTYSKFLGDCSAPQMIGNLSWVIGIYDINFGRFTSGKIYGRIFMYAIRMKDNNEFELDFQVIRKYLPELKNISNKDICKWHKFTDEQRKKMLGENIKTYPYQLLFNYEDNINRWKNKLANFK